MESTFTYSVVGPNALTKDEVFNAIEHIADYRKILYDNIIMHTDNQYYIDFINNLTNLGATEIIQFPDFIQFTLAGKDFDNWPAYYKYQYFHDAMYRLYIGLRYHIVNTTKDDPVERGYWNLMDGIVPLNLCYNVVSLPKDIVRLYI